MPNPRSKFKLGRVMRTDDNTSQSIFTQQAEYLSEHDLLAWAEQHPNEAEILNKLMQPGAKLITGPRGCGKTTLLKKAYYRMVEKIESRTTALPIYVNYKSSLKLEPLYSNNANAVYWFNQWLLYKVYQGLFDTIELVASSKIKLEFSTTKAETLSVISKLELGKTDIVAEKYTEISSHALEKDVEYALAKLNKNRCVLLLDDAAHAFSPQQQKDFFEFIRLIKSRTISPKAAIYPGITTYSAGFHVGHDAEEIDVWLKVDSQGYTEFMLGLLKKRLPGSAYDQLAEHISLLKLVSYASFGIPRSLLNMVSTFYREPEDTNSVGKVTLNRTVAVRAIKDNYEKTLLIYQSLSIKLPIYKFFVATGLRIYEECIRLVKVYNRDKELTRQSVDVAIAIPLQDEVQKVLGFLEYTGLLLYKHESRRGTKGTYKVYSIHYSALITNNALLNKQSLNVAEYVTALENRPPNTYPRVLESTLLASVADKDMFTLSLPPCHECNTPRSNADAKFCLNCGTMLKAASVFESLVNQPINALPLNKRKIAQIHEHTQIRTVKDILMDFGARKIRSIHGIGPVWAKRISSAAEEFIA